MPNNYVDFVSDEHFEKCVKHVCNAYSNFYKIINKESLQKHGADPFKMVFDMMNLDLNYESWLPKEKARQDDKTVNNTIGEFHQLLLGGVDGWTDLGIGDDTHLDLKKDDNSAFIEIKNKENTVNGSSQHKLRERLEEAHDENPDAICYWAYLVSENGKVHDRIWWPYTNARERNENIRRLSGKRIYGLVTGDDNNLKKVLDVLPNAIKNICGTNHLIGNDVTFLNEWFADGFEK